VLVTDERERALGAYPIPLGSVPAERQRSASTLGEALDRAFQQTIPWERLLAARADLASRIGRALDAQERVAADLRKSLDEGANAGRWKENGDLILANAHRILAEAGELIADDFYASEPAMRRIALDPNLTPAENAERCYARFRRVTSGLPKVEERLRLVERALSRLEIASKALPSMDAVSEVEALRRDLETEGILRPDQAARETVPGQYGSIPGGFRIRRHEAGGGWTLLWGENATSNDHLTTRLASPWDTWLHVRANTSAHVVVKGPRGAVPPRELLEQAALIAARHSAAKHSSAVPVDYTLKKHVRKPRGAPPGTVVYQNEKTLIVDPRRM
jgi:predicted ribosome quality control (RQC) complex YloA/Tae2 family protein